MRIGWRYARHISLSVVLGLCWMSVNLAQSVPVFRIGLIDAEQGALAQGARLAVEEINASGGVTGADGSNFQLELVQQNPDDMNTAIANINQARVVALIGPSETEQVLPYLSSLQALNVPVLTSAADDTVVALDSTGRILRLRAQEALVGRALASYLVRDLSYQRIATVQLDLESTAGMIGFTTALAGIGVAPAPSILLDDRTSLEQIVQQLGAQNPQAVVVYGQAEDAASLLVGLRSAGWTGDFVYNRALSEAFRALVPASILPNLIAANSWSYALQDSASARFVLDYVQAVGSVPNEHAAAGYDAIYLLARAIEQPDDLLSNLLRIRDFEGVQGILSPAALNRGEMSNNVSVLRVGRLGGQRLMARYAGDVRLPDDAIVVQPSQPAPTATPEGVYVTITRSVQNVRTGPSTQYDVLGQLRQGETAQVIGGSVDLQWVVINFRGQNGWLSRDILDLSGDTRSIPVIAPPPLPTPLPATATPLATNTPSPQSEADIIVVSVTPSRLTLGQGFAVLVTVKNNGLSNTGNFAVATSLMPGNVYTAVNIPSLAAQQSTSVTLTGVLPAGTTGIQSVPIIADLNNEVNEGAGEANNNSFFYTYVADAPLLVGTPIGSLTLGDTGTVSLDGGTPDLQWLGGTLTVVGGTQISVLNGFPNFDAVHYNAITSSALSATSLAGISPGMLIGIRTDGGNKYGVLQITSAVVGGNLTFNFRMYN